MPTRTKINTSYTQADGTVEIITPSWHSDVVQISFATDSSVGVLNVSAKYHPLADPEIVYEEDGTTPLVIDLTATKSFQLADKWVYSLLFTPTLVDVSYTPLLASGDFIE